MKMWVMSDLHVDANPLIMLPSPDADVIIHAGDIADGHERSLRWLKSELDPADPPHIYVLGNHDFWGYDLADDHVDKYELAGVTLLHAGRPSVVIGDTRFIGITLWTDFAIGGDVELGMHWSRNRMPDRMNIDIGSRRVGMRDLLELHGRQRQILVHELAVPFAGETVVVTHHAPHPRSIAGTIGASAGSFASDLTDIIVRYQPALWIHGHVHQRRDYTVGSTRIVSNPRGYQFENKNFDPQLILELGDNS